MTADALHCQRATAQQIIDRGGDYALALNVIQAEPSKGSLRGKLKRAGWDDNYLTELLKLFEVR